MALGKLHLHLDIRNRSELTCFKDIAPIYYDIDTFPKGEIKTAIQRTVEKVRRKQAMKGGH